ncbi:hypothetical protein F2Q69_00052916 [Brassica cretica]|uniref:Uncharacterized protein n=1 Tax=Brassica cretica TaxID=69181 RepID=A0A8S9N369_BRACR|nr:hypothetical protein F2Q69_00052916 [Brassica cretica]
MNWRRPDSFGLDWHFGTDHSTIVEWFDGQTTRRSSSGSMVRPLDDRRVACLGRPLDDRRVACLGRPLDDRRVV